MKPDVPTPPADLAARELSPRALKAGTPLWRIHDARRDPVWFGPAPGTHPRNRFDAPGGEFRVCYAGLSPEASFAETFLRNPGRRLLDRTTLESRSLAQIVVTRPLRLVKLYGPDLARVGATAEVPHGTSYDLSRQWALALWSHPQNLDGILYKARHDDDLLCLALYDRAADALDVLRRAPLIESADLPSLLRRYRLGFNPSG